MKLFIGLPTYGNQMTAQCAMGVTRLALALQARGVFVHVVTFSNCSIVQEVRNRIVSSFLATDCTHLLMIDADTEFRAEDVLAMLDAGKHVICCAIPKKEYDWKKIREAALRGDVDIEGAGLTHPLNLDEQNFGPETGADGCVPLLYATTALILIQREVILGVIENEQRTTARAHAALRRLVDLVGDSEACALGAIVEDQMRPGVEYRDYADGSTAFAVFDCGVINWGCGRRFVGEDHLFSIRARDAGFSLWLYVPAQVGHVGMQTFRGRLSDFSAALQSGGDVGDSQRRVTS